MRRGIGILAALSALAVCTILLAPAQEAAAQAENVVEVPPRGNAQLGYNLMPGQAYGLLLSVDDPTVFDIDAKVEVRLHGLERHPLEKTLHAGDPDWYVQLAPERAVQLGLILNGRDLDGKIPVRYELTTLGEVAHSAAAFGADAHRSWRNAQPIELDQVVYASGDERPYIPELGYPETTFGAMVSGLDWYRVEWEGPGERLVHFNVEVIDRDVPVDIAVFTAEGDEIQPYERGKERFEPEKSTVLHGLNKFVSRTLAPGTYYVRVMANHPAYKLETHSYDPPPYEDPQRAVRVAMDYIVRKGDSWHANIPRRGVTALRTANPVQETKVCIACHPTHFSTRGEMIAVENGYPVHARESLRFLVERLMNNPRPIYGHTDASWARMIHAPGNVLSRLAYISDKYERSLTPGERRSELYRGVAEFLELYWPTMEKPQPESNGNLPRVSGFEVAHHSGLLFGDLAERSGEEKYRELRERTERVAEAGEPLDMLDLSWQTVALVELGGGPDGKYQDKIAANVDKIFEHQKPDGSWAMPFGMEILEYDWRKHTVKRVKIPERDGRTEPLSSEFQSYHALYALAKAGVSKDDPRMQKAIAYCLAHQTESGAWQGPPEYKNFDTPFRDTQYAVMALSELYPGPAGRGGVDGWEDGATPPASFVNLDPLETVALLDRHWERPSDGGVKAIIGQLASAHTPVRRQAALALGRFAAPEAVEPLARALGDRSKLVQRAAAWALRQIAMRDPEAREPAIAAIREALRSGDARTRWGATRIFSQHFKYLAEEWDLGQELIRLTENEPSPAVKMQAIQGLYQWWFWDRSATPEEGDHKGAVEEALIAGLGRNEHPWVRRNFIEGYYNTLDDNLRYLYGSWMIRIKRDEDREVVRSGHQENVARQAMRFLTAMREGNERTRDGLMRALSTHVIREGQGDVSVLEGSPVPETVEGPYVNGYKWFAAYNPLEGGSGARAGAGNDSDPPKFEGEAARMMNEALLTALTGDSADIAEQALLALDFLEPFPVDEALAARMLYLVEKTDGELREKFSEAAREHLPGQDIAGPATAQKLGDLFASGDATSVETAAAVLAGEKESEDREPELAADPDVLAALQTRLVTSEPSEPVFAPLVRALAAVPAEKRGPALVEQATAGLNAAESRAATVELLLSEPGLFEVGAVQKAWSEFLASASPEAFADALARAGEMSFSDDEGAVAQARELVTRAMDRPEPEVRVAALSALRTIGPIQQSDAVSKRLAKLLEDPDRDVRNSAVSFQASLDARAGREGYDTQMLLDYEFFKVNVEPILARKAEDGLACVNCHANHTIFPLREPDEYGVISHADSRANYRAATGVVNLNDPLNSLLLNKPTRPLDDDGVGDSQKLTHGGGLRWPEGRDSEEYRTILRWIQGERLGSAAEPSE